MDFFELALKVFDLDEGVKHTPYKDDKGYWTIGRGHLIGKTLQELYFSAKMIDAHFQEDLAVAIKDAITVMGEPFFNSITKARQVALVSMLFTLGKNKWLKFDETIAAMRNHEWEMVAHRILQSKWSRDVDPKQLPGVGRDDRIAYMFKTGEFHPDYKVTE